MPQEKKTATKKRPDVYDPKVKLDMSFEEAIKKLADKANKNVASALAQGKR